MQTVICARRSGSRKRKIRLSARFEGREFPKKTRVAAFRPLKSASARCWLFDMRSIALILSFASLALGQAEDPKSPKSPKSPKPPTAPQSAEKPAKPAVEQISETKFKLGAIEFDGKSREIRFPGVVNMTEGILEYVLVHVDGKDHESLLTTEISPSNLNVVLKLLRFKSGDGELFHDFYPPGELPEPEPAGDGIDVFVTWPGSIDNPLCGLIRDERGDSAMEPAPWTYTGSEVVDGRFQAEQEGSILAIYRDPLAMFNTPHPRALDDENWFPIRPNIPAMETPVTIIFRPAAAKNAPKNQPKTKESTK